MPAKCWIVPEMPAAMYCCGATISPVWSIGYEHLHGEESFRNQ